MAAGSNDGSKRGDVKVPPPAQPGRVKVPPPPQPARALGSLKDRLASLPEAQAGVVSGVGRAGLSSEPPTRTDLPTLAPPRRGGEGKSEGEVDADDIDVLLDMAEEEPDPKKRVSSMPPAKALSAICLFGRFEVLGRIAFGGMAEIFLGREQTSVGASRFLVIKRILQHVAEEGQFIEMFLDEARLAIQLNHPNICHIYEFGELDGSYFIAMEWVNGVPLGKMIRKARKVGGIPAGIGVRIIATIADALSYAHNSRDALGRRLSIVHRDVSPHNLMVAYDGQVKLLDFGIAKAASQESKTQAGTVKGKFAYMAPEQCLNRDLDARVDIFALGICLWETLSGETLFSRDNEFETMKAVIEDDPPPLRSRRPDIDDGLDQIVRRALAKRREDRYQTAAEFQTALEGWLMRSQLSVNAATIGELMEELYSDQIRRGPLVDSTPFGESFNRMKKTPTSNPSFQETVTPVTAPSVVAPELSPPVRPAWPYAVGLAAVALIGVAAWQLWPAPPPPLAVPETPTVVEDPPEPEPEPDPGPNVEVPAPLALGTLIVNSTPSGATVRVDGEVVHGNTPLTLGRMPEGTHRVLVERIGYVSWEGDVDVVGDRDVSVEARLVFIPRDRPPEAPPGHLSINTRPWSKVYIGRRLVGTTPIAEARVTSGELRLRLVDRDGNTHTRTVRVPPNGREQVFYDLTP